MKQLMVVWDSKRATPFIFGDPIGIQTTPKPPSQATAGFPMRGGSSQNAHESPTNHGAYDFLKLRLLTLMLIYTNLPSHNIRLTWMFFHWNHKLGMQKIV